MYGFILGYYRFSVWTLRLAYVNFCWILFTLLGLVLFGFMPATAAMFSIVRKWIEGNEDIPVFTTFLKHFKKNFIETNGLGLVIFLIGYLLLTEFQILRIQDSIVYYAVSIAVMATLMLYVVMVVYFFPVFVHFKLKWVDYLKWPFIIGIVHPILTLVTCVGLGLLYYVTWITIPALLFFFGGSVTALLVMLAISQTFSKYERTHTTSNVNQAM
ncbi:MAG TPA: DUF624 domain-containing protein [Virgibacillus sp.]|nr:DUF624 domain-containing protein [Virgibacillus sp.]